MSSLAFSVAPREFERDKMHNSDVLLGYAQLNHDASELGTLGEATCVFFHKASCRGEQDSSISAGVNRIAVTVHY